MKRGFTLIELVLVVAIISIGALIFIPDTINYIKNAQIISCDSVKNSLATDIRFNLAHDDKNNTFLNKLNTLSNEDNASVENTTLLLEELGSSIYLGECSSGEHIVIFDSETQDLVIQCTDPDHNVLIENNGESTTTTSSDYEIKDKKTELIDTFNEKISLISSNEKFEKVSDDEDLEAVLESVTISLSSKKTFVANLSGEVVIVYKEQSKVFYYIINQSDGDAITYLYTKKLNTSNKKYSTLAKLENFLQANGEVVEDDFVLE